MDEMVDGAALRRRGGLMLLRGRCHCVQYYSLAYVDLLAGVRALEIWRVGALSCFVHHDTVLYNTIDNCKYSKENLRA